MAATTPLRDRITAAFRGWQNPGSPQTPTAPPGTPARAFDYPLTQNLTTTPKRGRAGVSFRELKTLADNCYLMRSIIEKMKDRICDKPFHFQLKPEDGELKSDTVGRSTADKRVQAITEFFQYPDSINTWRKWLRMLLEQQIVIDAACLEVQRDGRGGITNLLPVDGSTINVLIDNTGRRPQYPDPAYQQVVQGGLPSQNFTVQDMVYMPRNTRVDKIYGFSPVEQTILLLQTIIYRNVLTMNSHDETNVPAGFVPVNPDMGTDEILRFMRSMNSEIENDLKGRTRLFPIPGGQGPVQLFKAEDPFQKYDEWAAKVLCFVVGETASPFTSSNNRATAQQSDDTREESGERPMMQWVKDEIDSIIQRPDMFNASNIELVWDELVDTDPLKQAQVDQICIAIGTRTPTELRQRDGFPALTPEQLEELAPPPPPVIEGGFDPQTGKPVPSKQPPGEKPQSAKNDDQAAKAAMVQKKKHVTIDPENAHAHTSTAALSTLLAHFFHESGSALAQSIRLAYARAQGGSSSKADVLDDAEGRAGRIVGSLGFDGWGLMVPAIADALQQVGQDAVSDTFAQLSLDLSTYDTLFKLANTQAVDYARDRAAEMVGMKYVDGKLVENPNARFAITDGTRDTLRQQITSAFDAGTSPAALATQIQDSAAFSEYRATLIARTETAFAQTAAAVNTSKSFGATGKHIQMSNEHDIDDVCDAADQQGVVPIDEPYASGDLHTPLHPGCKCVELLYWED
jgi:hypothetical protein